MTSLSQDLRLFSYVFFLRIYFPPDFIFCDLISWDFIESPHTILGKIVPGIQNTGLYSSYIFFQGLEKIRTFFPKFLFPGFFSETVFPGTFLYRFIWQYSRSRSTVTWPYCLRDELLLRLLGMLCNVLHVLHVNFLSKKYHPARKLNPGNRNKGKGNCAGLAWESQSHCFAHNCSVNFTHTF